MKVAKRTVYQCGFCSKKHDDPEPAEACCTCPSCGASPSKWCGLFKVCRLCDAAKKLDESRNALQRAKESVALHEKWFDEAKTDAAAQVSGKGESK